MLERLRFCPFLPPQSRRIYMVPSGGLIGRSTPGHDEQRGCLTPAAAQTVNQWVLVTAHQTAELGRSQSGMENHGISIVEPKHLRKAERGLAEPHFMNISSPFDPDAMIPRIRSFHTNEGFVLGLECQKKVLPAVPSCTYPANTSQLDRFIGCRGRRARQWQDAADRFIRRESLVPASLTGCSGI